MKDLKTRMSETERKYFLLKDELEKMETQLQIAKDETMMTRGEYRLLVQMKEEAKEDQKKKAEEEKKAKEEEAKKQETAKNSAKKK